MAVDPEIIRQKQLIKDILSIVCAPGDPPELPEDIKKCWYMLFEREFGGDCCLENIGPSFDDKMNPKINISIARVMGAEFDKNTRAWLSYFKQYMEDRKEQIKATGAIKGKDIIIGHKSKTLTLDDDLVDTLIGIIRDGGECDISTIDIANVSITADVEKIKSLIAEASSKGIDLKINEGLNSNFVPEFFMKHSEELASFVSDPENNISCRVSLTHPRITWSKVELSYTKDAFESSGVDRETANADQVAEIKRAVKVKISEAEGKVAKIKVGKASIDAGYGNRLRASNAKKLQKAVSFELVEPSEGGEVRKGKVSLADAGVGDVELSQSQEKEQEQEAEEEQEMMSEREAALDSFERTDKGVALEEYSGEVLSFDGLQSDEMQVYENLLYALRKTALKVGHGDGDIEVAHPGNLIISEGSKPLLAEYLLGNTRKNNKEAFEHAIQGLTPSAFDAVKYHLGHFSGGFDEDNLPHGFRIKVQEGKRVIDFDPGMDAGSIEYDPLRVRVERQKVYEPIRHDLAEYGRFGHLEEEEQRKLESFVITIHKHGKDWLDSALKIMEVQDKSTFDEMAYVDEDGSYHVLPEYEELFQALTAVDGKKPNSPAGQIKNILYSYGPIGVKKYADRLIKVKSSLGDSWLDMLIDPESEEQNDIDFLLNPDTDQTLDSICALSEKEKKWLFELIEKQQDKTRFSDIEDIFLAYKGFLREIKDLGIEINDDMPIPEDGNTKAALSRILYILKNTPSPNRKEQMANINKGMEISNIGAWYAKKHDGYYLVTEEMKLKGANGTYDGGYKSRYSSSDGANKSKGFKALTLLGISDPIDFYRYVGQQLHTAPFDKYRDICGFTDDFFAGKETRLGADGKFTVLGLLAIGTTGRKGKYCANRAQVEEFFEKFVELYKDDGVLLRGVKTKSNWLLQALADANNRPEVRDALTLEHMPSLLKYTMDLSKEEYDQESTIDTIKEGMESYGASYISAIQSIYKGMESSPELIAEPASFILKLTGKIDASGIESSARRESVLSIVSKCDLNDIYPANKVDDLIDILKGLPADEISLLSKTFMDIDLRTSTELPSAETLKSIIAVCKKDGDFSIGRTQSIIADAHPGCTFLSPPPASDRPRASLEDVLKEQVKGLGGEDVFRSEDYKDIKVFSVSLSALIVMSVPRARGPVISQVRIKIASHFKDCYVRDRAEALDKIRADFTDEANEGADRKLKALHSKLESVLKRYKMPAKDITEAGEFTISEGMMEPKAVQYYARRIHGVLRHGELIMAESEKFAMLSGIANRLKRKNVNDLSILLGVLLSEQTPLDKIGVVKTVSLLEAGMSVLEASSTSRFPNKLMKKILEHPNIANIASTEGFNNLIDIVKSNFLDSIKDQLLDASLLANGGPVISMEDWQEVAGKVPNKIISDLVKMQKESIKSGSSIIEFKDLIDSVSSDYAANETMRPLIEQVLASYAAVDGGASDFYLKMNKLKGIADIETRYNLLDILSQPGHSSIDVSVIDSFVESCVAAGDGLPERMRKFKQADLHKMDVSLDEIKSYALGELSLDELVEKYTQGALGQRKSEAKKYKHFDESQISRVIDSLGDLSTDPIEPLSLAARKKIATDMMYINSIGETEPLPEIEGVSAKPIIDMTDAEIRSYIKHCRDVVSNGDMDEEAKRIAKLNFLALSREALCRSTRDDSFAGVFAYTTQIISVLNSMHQGSMHLSEIDTGQGKSHIAALHAAMKWIEGDTVDICTSSMDLASEGLEEHKAFFDALGVSTSLVSAGSSPDSYARGGINYSTVSEMALFKARANIENTLGDVGETALILDEADFTTLDDTINYKYAGNVDGKPQGKTSTHAWVYRVINNFIDRDEFKDPRFKREDDIENLKSYVDMVCTEEQKRAFGAFDDEQLDKWLDSALSAKSLQGYGEYRNPELGDKKADYKVEEVDGEAYARILIHDLPSREASWSDGVHQFLHDRLNSSGKSEFEFNISPEADHLASTTAKDLIQSYGTVWGMTGTIGDVEERAEQAAVYGFRMTKVAPHQACRRLDREPEIEFGEEAHKRKVREAITSRIRSKSRMPAVVVCKDMDKSNEMLEDMLADFKAPGNVKKYRKLMPLRVQIFDGAKHEIVTLEYQKGKIVEGHRENVENTTKAKENAGAEGTITITTPIMGRGTDFKPKTRKGGAHPHGLLVVQSYVDIVRTSGQIVGRGGRNGQPGESLTIVDGEEMARELGVELDALSVDSDTSVSSYDSAITYGTLR